MKPIKYCFGRGAKSIIEGVNLIKVHCKAYIETMKPLCTVNVHLIKKNWASQCVFEELEFLVRISLEDSQDHSPGKLAVGNAEGGTVRTQGTLGSWVRPCIVGPIL
jgi:hypothetical protein